MKTKFAVIASGTAALVLTAAIFIALFSTLALSSDNPSSSSPISTDDYNWSYTVLKDGKAQSANAVIVDEFTVTLDCEDFTALCMSATLPNDMSDIEQLEFSPSFAGTEIYADNYLLYSNINYEDASATRDENGFLTFAEDYVNSAVTYGSDIIIPLGTEYGGAEIKIYTYYNEDMPFYGFLSYPTFTNDIQLNSAWVITSIMPTVFAVLSALAALTICVIFLVRANNGITSFRLLLVVLFFVFSAINSLKTLFPYSSVLKNFPFNIPAELYVLPVIFYFALSISKWRRITLLSLSIAVTIFLGYYTVLLANSDFFYDSTVEFILSLYFLAVIVLLILELILEKGRHAKLKRLRTIPVAIGILIVSVVVSSINNDIAPIYVFSSVFRSLLDGNGNPLNDLLCMFFALAAMAIIVAEFVWEYSERKKESYILTERSRHAINSYKMLSASIEETRAARHEMNHHMSAISALLQGGDTDRAKAYAAQVSSGLKNLPVLKYCDNVLINSIAGAYAQQAKDADIRFECTISCPEELGIEDSDLCVFLENMYENALEACRKVAKVDRFIKTDIKTVKSFLFISCQNSCTGRVAFDENQFPVTTKEDDENHGYGLSAMNAVAKKYNSILVLDMSGNVFSVKTNISLTQKEGKDNV